MSISPFAARGRATREAAGSGIRGLDSPAGDFLEVLQGQGISPLPGAEAPAVSGPYGGAGGSHRTGPGGAHPLHIEATTVFAFHCKEGTLMVGDHRATTGNVIFTDQAEKILELDSHSLMAIAGSPSVALEMARTLTTSFEYYRRSQLQSMSLTAKTRALARMLRENLPGTLQGFGVVAPIFAGWETEEAAKAAGRTITAKVGKGRASIWFYDPLGAHFEATQFASSGSGSLTIKSILSHMDRWGTPPPRETGLNEAVVLAIRVLMSAASLDSATGGVEPAIGVYPSVKLLTAEGIRTISPEEQADIWKKHGSSPSR
jgi:proteasome beta subunit